MTFELDTQPPSCPVMIAHSEPKKRSPHHLWLIPLILALENTAVVQIPHPWFTIYLYRGIPIVFGAALIFFGRSRFHGLQQERLRLSQGYLGLHIAAVALFAFVEGVLIRFHSYGSAFPFRALVWLWLALIPTLVLSLIGIFIPLRRLRSIAHDLGSAWAYAALCSAIVVITRESLRLSWDVPTSRVGQALQTASFSQARAVLEMFYPIVFSDPVLHLLGTDRFVVEITGTCSGIEGLALVSSLILVWFIFARRELRIGRALFLVPVALGMMWLLNLARLVALIGIGHAGYPAVAVNGFHSEAGWIGFTLVSLGFLLVAQHIVWFRKVSAPSASWAAGAGLSDASAPSRNVAAIYLAPFLAIAAATLISRASSASFEWLYPLRFLAAAAVLWFYRAEYRRMNWRFGVLGVVAGLVVGGMWIGAHYAWNISASDGDALKASLATLSPTERFTWIAFRVTAAVVTVPLAEELAFRGFIARRVMSAEVDSVSFYRLSASSVVISSVAFGLMHGSMWVVGIAVGVIFALVARFRGRLGEAVAAHAFANLVIAVLVLVRGDYSLW